MLLLLFCLSSLVQADDSCEVFVIDATDGTGQIEATDGTGQDKATDGTGQGSNTEATDGTGQYEAYALYLQCLADQASEDE